MQLNILGGALVHRNQAAAFEGFRNLITIASAAIETVISRSGLAMLPA